MKVAAVIVSMVLLGAVSGARAQQPGEFSAIAYSPNTRMIGIAQDNNSKEEAESVAMQNCRAEPGNPDDCKNAAWVKGGCVALAVASNGAWGGHYANDRAGATRNAIGQCGRYAAADAPTCAVVKVECRSGR